MAEYNPSKIIKDGNTYNFRDDSKIPLAGSNNISGDLIPSTDGTVNLGSPSYQWNQAYIKSLTINGVACGDILTHNASEFASKATTLSGYGITDAYTKTQVDKKVSDLVNSAPETLDTLNELASALGNDPNFATTIATQIGNKANDSDVVHKSGDETITDTKTFGRGTLIVNNGVGNNVHGEIKLNGSRSGYIVADNAADGVFNNASCGISILLQDVGKPLHVGSYKVDSNGRVFADNTNKNPVLTVRGSSIKSSILIPENDTSDNAFVISSELTYANSNPSKTLNIVFRQNDDADATSAIYSNTNNVTSLGISTRRWTTLYGYLANLGGTYVGNEASANERSNLYLLANRDTDGQSGAYIGRFRQNRAQGAMSGGDVSFVSLDFLENSTRYTRCFTMGLTDWDSNGVPQTYYITSPSGKGSLGTSYQQWNKVYANEYYYGTNNTPFTDKFVTTDTAQTIAGNKTFSGRGTFSADCIAYNPDSSGTTSGVKLRNSKAEVLSTGNTASDQYITFRDKNDFNFGYIRGAVQSNGVAIKIGANAKDSSDTTINTELQLLAYSNGNKAIFPTTTGTYELGLSTYKWKNVNTVLLNGKTPAYNDDVIPRSGGAVMTGDLLASSTINSIGFGYGWGNGGTIYTYSPTHSTAEWQGTIRLEPLKTTSNFKTMQLAPDGTWTWSGTACQITSDQRFKQQITEIDDKLLDAWEDVELSQFKYNDAVEQKGKDKARLHTGFVVQQIDSACKKHGVDISNYGLYCHEVYPEETKEVEIEQADGTKTKETKVIREASEHYSLRYTEALIVECKYLRRCVERLTARIEELEKGNNSK